MAAWTAWDVGLAWIGAATIAVLVLMAFLRRLRR